MTCPGGSKMIIVLILNCMNLFRRAYLAIASIRRENCYIVDGMLILSYCGVADPGLSNHKIWISLARYHGGMSDDEIGGILSVFNN
jgi:hypothetical protein